MRYKEKIVEWEERDWSDKSYFSDAIKHIEKQSFVDCGLSYPPIFQIGVWLVERIDSAITDAIEEEDNELLFSAIAAFQVAVQEFTDEVEFHIKNSIGPISYSGLLSTENQAVHAMWTSLAGLLKPGFLRKSRWLFELSKTVISDPDFGSKVSDAWIYAERGMDRVQIATCIFQDYKQLGAKDSSASKLLELGVI